MLPNSKPQIKKEEIDQIISRFKLDRKMYPVVLVGIRGYYLNTMGVKGKNDRGIYDDALIWNTPNGFASFNGNTDPSAGYRKHLATLKKGVWMYKPGNHNSATVGSYPAFRQAADVTVIRDGEGEDTGQFGINIHKGLPASTSSLGCQTIPPTQWEAFRSYGYSELKRCGQVIFPYILIDEQDRKPIQVIEDPTNTVIKLSWDNEVIKKWSDYLVKKVTDNISILSAASDCNDIYPGFESLSVLKKIHVLSEFLVNVAYYESGWKENSAGIDVGNAEDKDTWSVGLFQVSVVDQKNYGMSLNYNFKELTTALPNIDLTIEILKRQIKKRGKIFLDNKDSARYWAVILKGNKYSKIADIIKRTRAGLPF